MWRIGAIMLIGMLLASTITPVMACSPVMPDTWFMELFSGTSPTDIIITQAPTVAAVDIQNGRDLPLEILDAQGVVYRVLAGESLRLDTYQLRRLYPAFRDLNMRSDFRPENPPLPAAQSFDLLLRYDGRVITLPVRVEYVLKPDYDLTMEQRSLQSCLQAEAMWEQEARERAAQATAARILEIQQTLAAAGVVLMPPVLLMVWFARRRAERD